MLPFEVTRYTTKNQAYSPGNKLTEILFDETIIYTYKKLYDMPILAVKNEINLIFLFTVFVFLVHILFVTRRCYFIN